jgi:type II secretory pathway pseudopilin PulG
MNQQAKAPVIVLIALIIISLGLAGGGFYLFQKEQKKSTMLEQQLNDTDAKLKTMEEQFQEAKSKISELQLKLEEAKVQIDKMSDDLRLEKASKQEALTKIELLRSDLEQQKELRADLEQKFNQAQDEARKTQAVVKDMEAQKSSLETRIKDLEAKTEGVELGTIVVSPEAQKAKSAKTAKTQTKVATTKVAKTTLAAAKALEGKVLVLNKDYNFAVISLGSKDGVKIGETFSVYHNNKYVGDIKVEKLHDAMAAAGFTVPDLKNKIDEGDKVVRK